MADRRRGRRALPPVGGSDGRDLAEDLERLPACRGRAHRREFGRAKADVLARAEPAGERTLRRLLPLLVVIAGLVGVWLGASIFASIS